MTREVALRRRALRQAWFLLLLGLIVPPIALWAGVIGWGLRDEEPRQAWALLTLGITVFVVRLAIYVL